MLLNRFGLPALVCALVLAGCGGPPADDDAQATNESESATGNGEDEEETPPVPVETGFPVRGDVYAIYAGTAPIEAFAEADVIAKVEGVVREILVEEGTDVREGQVLARLDGDLLRLELNESEARLNKLRRDYERNVNLKEKGLISSGDFDKIRYEMEALEASYNLARLELDYTQIRAPIDGVVSERYIKIGNTIAEGDPVFRVTSFDPLVAYLHVPERQYGNIRADQPAGIEIDALPGQRIMATVTRVSPIVDPDTGTFKVTIEIRDAERRIKPGMFGRIGIVFDRHTDAVQVPRSAIIEDDGETSVFVVADGTASRKSVTTGYSNRGMVEVIEGLDDDDEIITVGQVGLKDNAAVRVINADENAADEPDKEARVADAADVEDGDDASTD